MTEEPESVRVTEVILDTPIPSTVDGFLQLGNSLQVSHSNSAQNPTKINPDAATLDYPSGEYSNVHSQSSHLIPEYSNLRISGLRRSKIIQEREKNRYFIPNFFGFITLVTYVFISVTKSIIPETAMCVAKLIQNEEISKSYPENLPNFTNPLISNI